MKEKYQHSGKVPPLGVALGLLTGLVASVPLAYLYDYGIINVPYVKLRMIFTLLFGFLVGIATGWGLTLGKVRNGKLAVAMGVVISLAAWYISWGAWLLLIFEKPAADLFRLLVAPRFLWDLVLVVNTNGTWAMSGSATTGIELWILWGLEALTVIVCGWGGSVVMMNRRPFCEKCDRWCDKSGQVLVMSTLSGAEVMSKVNQSQYDFLHDAALATAKQPHFTFAWNSCGSCGALNMLTISETETKNSKVLASRLVVSAGEIEQIRSWQATAAATAAK